MRVFLAIELDKDVKDYLKEIQEKVKEHSSAGSFTSYDNFHLTLKFIGEVNPLLLPSIKEDLLSAVMEVEGFSLTTEKLGYFERKSKKIIWVGVSGGIQKLHKLYSTIEANMEKIGIPKEERPYSPHITLGRQVMIDNFLPVANSLKIFNKKIIVEKVTLMESKREEGRLVYKPIFSVYMKK